MNFKELPQNIQLFQNQCLPQILPQQLYKIPALNPTLRTETLSPTPIDLQSTLESIHKKVKPVPLNLNSQPNMLNTQFLSLLSQKLATPQPQPLLQNPIQSNLLFNTNLIQQNSNLLLINQLAQLNQNLQTLARLQKVNPQVVNNVAAKYEVSNLVKMSPSQEATTKSEESEISEKKQKIVKRRREEIEEKEEEENHKDEDFEFEKELDVSDKDSDIGEIDPNTLIPRNSTRIEKCKQKDKEVEMPKVEMTEESRLEIIGKMKEEIEKLIGFSGIDTAKIFALLVKNEMDSAKAVTRVLRNRSYYRKYFALSN